MKQKLIGNSYVVLLVSIIIMIGFYFNAFSNINNIIFAHGGDGLKNYYTYLFQAKYGTTFWEFKGMNYPFYEHIVYTDAHPLFSYIIGKLGLQTYGIGILNTLMLLAFPTAAFFIHKILKYYKVSNLLAFAGSISICFLAPQIFRLTGHLSLSYAFVIPVMWLFLLKINDNKNWKWPSLMALFLFIFLFIHPYLGLILAIFGLSFALIFFLFDRVKWLYYVLRIGLPIMLPIVLFQFIVNSTDTHLNRMKTPAGFFDLYSSWYSLFYAHHQPFSSVYNWLNVQKPLWETWNYLGFFTIVSMAIFIWFAISNFKKYEFKKVLAKPMVKIYLVGHLVLLFSFCFPLKYDFFKWIVESLGPLKQFRVLGRFTWVYFYISGIGAIVFVQYLINNHSKKWLYFFWGGMVFSMIEIIPVHLGVSKAISQTANPFQYENLSNDQKEIITWTKSKDYDAILFLPFAHFSSENLFILGAEKANADAMILSYHTGLPLLNTLTSRNSMTETVLYQNLFAPEFIEKELLNVIGPDKKILLVKNKNGLDINELKMIWSSKEVFKDSTYRLFDITNDTWNNPEPYKKLIALNVLSTIDLNDGWRSDTNSVNFYYNSFEDRKEVNSMLGNGAFAGQKTGINLIENELNNFEDGTYICSFWYHFNIDRADQIAVLEQKFRSGRGEWVAQKSIRETNLVVGDWAYVELEFEVSDSVENTKLFLAGNASKKWFVIDELMIRKVGEHALFKSARLDETDYLIYNNYWMKANSYTN